MKVRRKKRKKKKSPLLDPLREGRWRVEAFAMHDSTKAYAFRILRGDSTHHKYLVAQGTFYGPNALDQLKAFQEEYGMRMIIVNEQSVEDLEG